MYSLLFRSNKPTLLLLGILLLVYSIIAVALYIEHQTVGVFYAAAFAFFSSILLLRLYLFKSKPHFIDNSIMFAGIASFLLVGFTAVLFWLAYVDSFPTQLYLSAINSSLVEAMRVYFLNIIVFQILLILVFIRGKVMLGITWKQILGAELLSFVTWYIIHPILGIISLLFLSLSQSF